MKLAFERPDYCEGCLAADLRIETLKVYCDSGEIADGDTVFSSDTQLKCDHDQACLDLHRRLVNKYFTKLKEV